MKHHDSVFHQLLKVIPRHQFQKMVDLHEGDHRFLQITLVNQALFQMGKAKSQDKTIPGT